jgi:hypothetical protein
VSLNGAYVALKSANTFTATVTDSFGAPVAGVLLTPVVSGSNADVTGRATVVTGATGTATITLTDAAAVAAGTDTVTFTENGTAISGASTITYAATAPAATALTATYSTTVAAALAAITTPAPSTGIYYTGSTRFSISNDRDTSRPVVATAGTELVIKIAAGVAGVAVKAEPSKGAYVLASTTALEATSRTRYTDADGFTSFQVGTHTSGANTVTFTSGTVTTSVAFWGASATGNARFVTLTGPATLAANGTAGSYVAAVTDRYGNPVSGVVLSISATGVAVLGGLSNVSVINTNDVTITESNVSYIDGVRMMGKNNVFTLTQNATIGSAGIYLCTGAITVTMDTKFITTGDIIQIKRSAGGVVTISGGGITIDGAATFTLNTLYDSATLYYTGTEYLII